MKDLINPVCEARVLNHGEVTERAVVLIHGFTNCPQMWAAFGERVFARGSNVLIPRLPRHGLADRLTDSPAGLTADELRQATGEAVFQATTLGRKVTVAGLSLGAVLAARAAITSERVDRAVLIAPLFAAPGMPIPVSDAVGFLAGRVLPNRFVWWDGKTKERIVGPAHAYPRFATRGYGAMLQLGSDIRRAALRRAPLTPDLRIVTNAADPAVNNEATSSLAAAWRRRGAEVREYCFPRELGLLHDLIDPAQAQQQTALVYPVLERWICDDEPPEERRPGTVP